MALVLISKSMGHDIWQQVLPHISRAVDHNRYETWFKPLVALDSGDPAVLTLSAPNQFVSDFLDQHFGATLLSLAQKVSPSIRQVRFVPAAVSSPAPSPPARRNAASAATSQNTLNPQYTFDLFVVGPTNEFAKSVAMAVAEAPGHTKFNPLLIYGGVGLGKTHLLHAIGNHVSKSFPDAEVTYVTSEEFYFAFIDAIKNNTRKEFSDRFRQSTTLLVDDIQFLVGKESTQEEFFYIFNTLYQSQKQIILTSDLPPASIQGLQDRLLSRFQWGLCVDIQPPNLETRVAIIQKKAERDNLSISEDILYFIAENVSSNIREIEGILIKLLAFASITNTDITLDLVRGVLRESIKKEPLKISLDEIIDRVAEYYKIPPNTLREKNRRKEVAQCRQIAMFIAKTLTNNSLKTIGLHFGGRDHSTVIHAVQQIESLRVKDESVQRDINYISSLFSQQ
ncbi:MAG: chromosomal replication initiator protein DnaA [Chitinivibrionales bacterium]|nr:chromosomal replication initiator protein DnaA [Chitinivibrionales bacterium]